MTGVQTCALPIWTFSKYPKESEKECISRYPVSTQYITSQEYIPGDTVYIPGVSIDCDSVINSLKGVVDTVYIKKTSKVPCPPTKYVHDTVRIKELVKVEDTRKLDIMTQDLLIAKDDISDLQRIIANVKRTRNSLWGISVILFLIL